jgi:PPK2 family polyphosphate:nucleotide phosphotransferase
MGLSHKLMVTPGSKPHLAKRNPGDTPGVSGPRAAAAQLTLHTARLAELQHVMWAENKHSLLVVLQGMDTSGKDGTIRHVFTGVNPQGCRVTSFKVPSAEEADHDFLWRVHAAAPRLGEIGMFNRSHYEDVLVVRVHGLVPKEVWRARYRQINAFERHLTECGTTVLKFYLHISREEQRRRLLARIEDPKKNWKMSEGDLRTTTCRRTRMRCGSAARRMRRGS